MGELRKGKVKIEKGRLNRLKRPFYSLKNIITEVSYNSPPGTKIQNYILQGDRAGLCLL